MKRARRVLSHHGSDCPTEPHSFKHNRCVILTRIDRPGQPSEAWVSGDCQETVSTAFKREHSDWYHGGAKSERMYKHRHTFKPSLPVHYGGGFWERVELGPVEEQAPVLVGLS